MSEKIRNRGWIWWIWKEKSLPKKSAKISYLEQAENDPMKGAKFIWVHLYHPCKEIDVWYVTQPEEARAARRQGYIPLTELRAMIPGTIRK